MHSQVKVITTSVKLPGYLFVLTGITSIGDAVYLYCPQNSYEFLSSMLNMIGLQTRLMTDTNVKYNSLIIIDTYQEIKNINFLIENNNYPIIIYVMDNTFLKMSPAFTEKFILRYPQCILVINSKIAVGKKEFSVLINQQNPYYKKIKEHVELFGNC